MELKTILSSAFIAASIITAGIAVPGTAEANLWNNGDVIAANSGGTNIIDLTTGTSINITSGTSVGAVAELNANTLLVGDKTGHVYEVNQSGIVSQFATSPQVAPVSTIQADTSGNVFVTTSSVPGGGGGWGTTTLEYSNTGALKATVATMGGTSGFGVNSQYTAMAQNENVIYGVWTAGGIDSYNLGTKTFAIIPGATSGMSIQGIAVLPSGNLLVSSYGYVYDVNPATGGILSQSTDRIPNAYGNIAMNAAGSAFWTNNGSSVYEYTLAGLALNSYSGAAYDSVAVIGGENAIISTQTTSSQTPAPEPGSAALLVGMLGMLGAVRLSRFGAPSRR